MPQGKATPLPRPDAPLFTQPEWETVVRLLRLAPQQARIVRLILAGKRDKQIAADLGISISTIRTHLRHLFTRLAVSDRTELAVLVFQTFRQHQSPSHCVFLNSDLITNEEL